MEERRRATRFDVWLPLELRAHEAHALCVTQNVSKTGVLVLTAERLALGSEVVVNLGMALDDASSVDARVMRVESNTDDPEGLWPLKIALAFSTPLERLETHSRKLEARNVARPSASPPGGEAPKKKRQDD
jgi:hypothetical protein